MQAHARATMLCGFALSICACTVSAEPPDEARHGDDAPSSACIDDVAYGDKQGTIGSEEEPTNCDYNDVYHCREAHQGWRWVHIDQPRSVTDQTPPGTGYQCCVRVGLPQRSRGYRR